MRWAVEQARSRTGGKLKLEGAAGSLAGTTRIARLTYTDKDLVFVAENVEFTWSPRALFSRSVVIDSLSASQITLEVKPGDGVNAPPVSLALPWSIAVQRASVDHLDVASGSNRWRFARLAFRYAGDDKRHSLDELAFHSEWGDLSGSIAVEASAPFVTTGSLTFLASEALKRAKATLSISGDLTSLALSADVSAVGARAGGTSAHFAFRRALVAGVRPIRNRRRPRAFRFENSQDGSVADSRGCKQRPRPGARQAGGAQRRSRTDRQQAIADPGAVLDLRIRHRHGDPGCDRSLARQRRSRRRKSASAATKRAGT